MSKERDKIIQALENMSITFDELGFAPTTLTDKKCEHFGDWFKYEIAIIKAVSKKQDEQLEQTKSQINGYQKAIEKRDKKINSLNKGFSKVEKRSYKIKESKYQDILTMAQQTERERELLKQLALTEKALELACEEMIEDLQFDSEDDRHYTLQENIEYFKTMAKKEIVESE